jgi:hypothetical protein
MDSAAKEGAENRASSRGAGGSGMNQKIMTLSCLSPWTLCLPYPVDKTTMADFKGISG